MTQPASSFLLIAATALLLAGCGPLAVQSGAAEGATPAASGLYPAPARITESRTLHDRQTLAGVQERLRRLNESGLPQGNYGLAKAQCWLDTAITQYNENDRTGYVDEALTESARIVQALETDPKAKIGFETPLIARSSKLRPDLWAQLGTLKSSSAALACNARSVACAEVRLVRAGHADEQTGWRQATVHVQMVEDGIQRARQEAARCGATATATPAAAAATK